MIPKLSIQEVTQQLPVLLDEIEKRPEQRYYITVDDRIVAEMRAVRRRAIPGATGKRLVEAAEKLAMQGEERHSVARNHDEYIYPNE